MVEPKGIERGRDYGVVVPNGVVEPKERIERGRDNGVVVPNGRVEKGEGKETGWEVGG